MLINQEYNLQTTFVQYFAPQKELGGVGRQGGWDIKQ